MTATRILDALESLDVNGEDAAAAARMGFLEWVFTQPGPATPVEAREALDTLVNTVPASNAGQAFVAYLQQASLPVFHRRRRCGRVRRLH